MVNRLENPTWIILKRFFAFALKLISNRNFLDVISSWHKESHSDHDSHGRSKKSLALTFSREL